MSQPLTRKIMLDYKKFSALMRSAENKMGGFDFLAVDHVGQFELMFDGCGNQIIKQLQSFTKTYTNVNGVNPATLFACQTNREGEKRARKRGGLYDIQAVSDLNEVERSSTYLIFLYTSEDMVVVQETKMCMLKHRLGSCIT